MDNQLPALRKIELGDLEASGTYPSPKIRTDADVELWKTTQSYRDYGLFLQRLNEAVVGVYLPWNPPQRSLVCLLITASCSPRQPGIKGSDKNA